MDRKRKFTELSPADEGLTCYSVDVEGQQLCDNLMENIRKESVKGSKIVSSLYRSVNLT